MLLKEQNFGVEIELTGITRPAAAKVIAEYFGTDRHHEGTHYDTYTATDRKGRTWKAMSDSSIDGYYKVDGQKVFGGRPYSCEIVTPILQYEDIEDLQKIVRALVANGAFANSSCGIHVHVDGANHTPQSLTRLLNFAIGSNASIFIFLSSLFCIDKSRAICYIGSGGVLPPLPTQSAIQQVFG